MLASNREMMDLFEHLGPVRIVGREGGTIEIEVAIPPGAAARARLPTAATTIALPQRVSSASERPWRPRLAATSKRKPSIACEPARSRKVGDDTSPGAVPCCSEPTWPRYLSAGLTTTKRSSMQLLATYTFGQGLLTVLEVGLLFLWIWLAITVVIDIFRSHDLTGWAKAGWLVLIVLVPLLGVLAYVIARNDKMKAHQVSDERQQELVSIAELEDLKDRGILTDQEFERVYKQRKLTQKAPPSPDDDIAGLEALKHRGLLTDEEFRRAKDKALAA
jgi:hypothetical protein